MVTISITAETYEAVKNSTLPNGASGDRRPPDRRDQRGDDDREGEPVAVVDRPRGWMVFGPVEPCSRQAEVNPPAVGADRQPGEPTGGRSIGSRRSCSG